MKLLRGLLILVLGITFVSCEDNHIEPIPTYELSIDSLLTEAGTQSVRRITGSVLKDDMEPTPAEFIEWESSHNWVTGDNQEAYVVRSTINVLGQWVVIDTIQLNIPAGLIVPTVNSSSYSGTGGEINTMIAPIYEMKGDTMTVTARMWTPYETYYDTLKVILE